MMELTIADVRDSIRLMRARLEDGQGQLHMAMCRLSLPMSELLLAAHDVVTTRESAAVSLVMELAEYDHEMNTKQHNSRCGSDCPYRRARKVLSDEEARDKRRTDSDAPGAHGRWRGEGRLRRSASHASSS